MRQTLLTLYLMLAGILSGQAQQSKILEQINSIKAQSDLYYWDQYTHPIADTARIGASKRVLLGINVERDEDSQLELEQVLGKMQYIKMDRGNVVRVFAYLKKSDVTTVNQYAAPMASGMVAAPPQPQPVREEARAFVPDAFVQRVMRLSDFFKVYDFLREQKLDGQVMQFGPLKDVEDYSSLDLILFDMDSRTAISLLSAEKGNGIRTNMLTGADDSLDNYPEDMTLVIWYIK